MSDAIRHPVSPFRRLPPAGQKVKRGDTAAVSQLEEALRTLARKGELTYLSLIPVAGKGEYGNSFCAQVSAASKFGHSEGRDGDPVAAILKAIEGLPKSFAKDKPKRKTREFGDPGREPEPWDII